MKVWPFFVSLLAACCPVPLQEQATAFRAVVVGVSPGASALHLEPARASPPLTLIVTDGVLRSSTGQSLPLGALEPGDRVYVQGTLSVTGELRATAVRRLE